MSTREPRRAQAHVERRHRLCPPARIFAPFDIGAKQLKRVGKRIRPGVGKGCRFHATPPSRSGHRRSRRSAVLIAPKLANVIGACRDAVKLAVTRETDLYSAMMQCFPAPSERKGWNNADCRLHGPRAGRVSASSTGTASSICACGSARAPQRCSMCCAPTRSTTSRRRWWACGRISAVGGRTAAARAGAGKNPLHRHQLQPGF